MSQNSDNDNDREPFVATPEAIGKRLDVFLTECMGGWSRSQIKKAIESDAVRVNGAASAPSYCLKRGDRIDVDEMEPQPETALEATPYPLAILFEDESLVVVNKPAGLTVHPGAGTRGQPTLVGALIAAHRALPEAVGDRDSHLRPGIVHRLDKDTSGAIVVAKTSQAHRVLSEQFAAKTNKRIYVALLDAFMKVESVTRESYLVRDAKQRTRFCSLPDDWPEEVRRRGRFARSHFTRKEVYGNRVTLASVRLDTGRTHQIRVHARDLGWPLIGDSLYHHATQVHTAFDGPLRASLGNIGRQMLHAEALGFKHPTSGNNMEFNAPWPEDMNQIVERLRSYRTL